MTTGSARSCAPETTPLDPLQARELAVARRLELVEVYEQLGHPERAEYVRRIGEGPAVVREILAALGAGDVEHALHHAVQWWATPELVSQLRGRHDGPGPALASALVYGLAARVGTRLQPAPRELIGPAPSWFVYEMLRFFAGYGTSIEQSDLPSWTPPDQSRFRLIVCDCCSFVDARQRGPSHDSRTGRAHGVQCRLCGRRHIQKDTVLVPQPPLPPKALRRGLTPSVIEAGVIGGYRQLSRHECEHCGGEFYANADARTHRSCRVARFRENQG